MKRLIFLLILLPSLSWGQETMVARMNPYVLGAGTVAAGCSGDYGNSTEGNNNSGSAGNFSYMLRQITIACSGSTTSFSVYALDADSDSREIKVVVYNDSGADHPTTLIVSSDAIYGYDPGWATFTSSQVLAAGKYWVGILMESSGTDVRYTDETGYVGYYYAESDFTPDNDLSVVGTVNTNYKNLSVKITF